ncbi:anti-sigma factor [Longimicrobium sp.]|uniref:anti-sigma factor n=1 Tax=Longimicrobium sp. TaxID=2029185 RepID=UPI002CFE37C1|nr:anti-sigma factor [Longimicrobium sp.]HSU16923.1 anti-sigma factor [Longimicrobium sp.]
MSPEMGHDDVRTALAAEALGALDGDEAEAVRAHLADCAECRSELEELREAAAALAHAAPPAPMDADRSARLRARLVARAAADRAGGAHDANPDAFSTGPALKAVAPPLSVPDDRGGVIPIARARERRGGMGGWLAAAAAVLLLIGVGAYAARMKGRYDALSERYASLDDERTRLVRSVARRDSTLASLSGAGVQVIELASTQRRAPNGRMFWDPATARWTFFAHDMPALKAGRDYQLWLITPAGPVSAGTFRPSPDGGAVVQATYPLPRDQLKAIAVTEEPAGGLPKPSGTPLIVGTYGTTE